MKRAVHIGCEKTGTTTLQKYLFGSVEGVHYTGAYSEEENSISVVGAVHGDADVDEVSRTWEKTIEKKSDENDTILYSHEFLTSKHLSVHDTVAERLRRIVGDADILITIRNQPDIAESHYYNFVDRGWKESFDEFMEAGLETLDEEFEGEEYIDEIYNQNWGYIWSAWQYEKVRDIWLEQFDNVYLLPLEAWNAQTELSEKTLADFLGVEDEEIWIPDKKARARTDNLVGTVASRTRVDKIPHIEKLRPVVRSGSRPIQFIDEFVRERIMSVETSNEQKEVYEEVYGSGNRKINGRTEFDLHNLGYPVW